MISVSSSLHAVEDESQEDEGVVAVIGVQVPHHTLAQLPKIPRFGELALVYKAGPRTDGLPPAVHPILNHTTRQTFGQPEPDNPDRQEISITGVII